MRPLRLDLEGFTVFRKRTSVDFTGADLFALSGPTGAGKTSLIDAITFALYGAVPRLDRRAVAPVVSQNLTEARVRLDFAVGAETYTAIRVVRTTKSGGATTKEARLERHGVVAPGAEEPPPTVVAGNADEVTSEVTALLGLTYEHFTTCVSLPQGQFARFLHDKPRDRQELLVRLLGLDIYDRVAGLARGRASVAKSRADVLDGQLAQLAAATPAARAAAQARVEQLAELSEKLGAARSGLEDLAARAQSAKHDAETAEEQLRLLDGLTPPGDVAELSRALSEGAAERARLHEAETAAAAEVTAREAALAGLPPRSQLESRRSDLVARDDLVALLEKGRQAARDAEVAMQAAAGAEITAEAHRAEAAAALERVRVEQRAHALVPALEVGAACPVCQQTVHQVPDMPSPEVASAEGALAEAERELKAATRDHSDARMHHAKVEEKLVRVEADLAAVTERLRAGVGGSVPELGDVDDLLAQVGEAERSLEDARRADRELRQQRIDLDARRESLAGQEAAAWRALDAARDDLAVLRPPATDRSDLAGAWAGLAEWAGTQRPALGAEARRQRELAAAAVQEHAARWAELVELCRSAEVDLGASAAPAFGGAGVDILTEPVAVARARAEDAVRRIDEDLAEAERLRQEQGTATERRQVAEMLAEHLKANRFEKWLLDEAMRSLAAGASRILEDLSGGAYALSVDARSGAFTVIDHANASQIRSARTLSGGETFLASLALALGLAEQVAELAAGETARLEALFLDEGFGTLDADTLDVVATALDELGARGRMVGVVTHVRELAERLPTRFEVRKVGADAVVERVEGV